MALVIRVLYNNRGWKEPCVRPGTDPLCFKCFQDNNLEIAGPEPSDVVCSGRCWERDICVNYEWGCTPKGKKFGKRAYAGQRAFFAFQQPDGNYTLWGVTTVDGVNVPPKRQLIDHETPYKWWLSLEPFEPLPPERWIRNLRDVDLVGEQWRQGRHRYIGAEIETRLRRQIEGTTTPSALPPKASSISKNHETSVTVVFAPHIYNALVAVSQSEGRSLEEIIRQATAEWLRKREIPGTPYSFSSHVQNQPAVVDCPQGRPKASFADADMTVATPIYHDEAKG